MMSTWETTEMRFYVHPFHGAVLAITTHDRNVTLYVLLGRRFDVFAYQGSRYHYPFVRTPTSCIRGMFVDSKVPVAGPIFLHLVN